MSTDQTVIFLILGLTVAMFVWGRWRHDMVALGALLACVATGLVPAEGAFAGFGHPAVITVASVLVLSRGLQNSGAVDAAAGRLLPAGASALTTIAALTGLAALLSGFMNNVGALALLMPVAIQAARRLRLEPGQVLMPVAFGSILGGMTTLIGTPPNLIISAYRRQVLGDGFAMFDFAPVGLATAVAGLGFITLIGWRLVPARRRAGVEGFEAGAYVTEARVPEDSRAAGMTIREIEQRLREPNVQVLGLIRREVQLRAPGRGLRVRAGDILSLEAVPEGMSNALSALGLKLAAAIEDEDDAGPPAAADGPGPGKAAEPEVKAAKGGPEPERAKANGEVAEGLDAGDVMLMELVVTPNAGLIGRSARGLGLRARYQANLLAVSRQGRRSIGRLGDTPLAAGDVLLMQGAPEAIAAFAADHGCLPLAERPLTLPDRRQMGLAVGIFATAIAVAASGFVPAAVAFAGGVLAVMATRVVPPRAVYSAVDWPVIVLLACLLPVAGALQATGAADLVAGFLVGGIARGAPVVALALILVLSMTLSDLMNNAATVAVMAPIAHGAALSLGAAPDAFFMAVAIGGSCAFLTPIGHQNNTLILGPGGFHFGDYWRLGLPLEAVVVAVAVPALLLVWGL